MDYFEKIESAPQDDLIWNIPEQKQGTVNIIGGNAQSFRTEVKIAELMTEKYPINTLNLVFPDALKTKLPPLPNFIFLPSTESGSFAESQELVDVLNKSDYNLILGDLSKNSITKKAISSAYKSSEKPLLVTRDGVDAVIDNQAERILMNENLILLASMTQLQSIFRAVYYPKMLLLSGSLIQVAEALHKFTLSYPVKIITLHNNQILIVESGSVKAVPLDKTGYTPLSIWQGELAASIAALNLYNPNHFSDAGIAALLILAR